MNNITGHTGLTALLGSPVAHSISPLMHNESFRLLGLDYVYLCFDINDDVVYVSFEGTDHLISGWDRWSCMSLPLFSGR